MKFCIILSARALNTKKKTKGFVNNHGNLSRPHKLYAKRICGAPYTLRLR